MVSAERAAHELRDQARREADLIVNEAQATSRSITRQASEQHEHLIVEARRVRAILRAALEVVDETQRDEPREAEAA
jgi:hypothetical protein